MTADESATEEVLGTTTVSDRWRISLLKDVRDARRNRHRGSGGDRLVYKRHDERTVIEPA